MNKILREPELLKLTGLSRTTLWRREQAGDFPKRRRISSRLVGWVLTEVMEWISTRPLAEGKEKPVVSKKPAGPQKSAGSPEPKSIKSC